MPDSAQQSGITFTVTEGRLTGVNGEYPAIATALEGLPADLDVAAFAAHIAAAIPFGTSIAETLPGELALAIRQQLRSLTLPAHEEARIGLFAPDEVDHRTASWKELDWRIISETPQSAATNVALDEVLMDRVAEGQRPPTLRFWGWSEPAIIIGRCQSVSNEVDLAAANELGFRVVRRMSGGGAMFIQPHGAITYSLILPESAVRGLTIRQSYEVCDAWVIRGLRALGIDAHHVPVNDIACAAGKIGGAAQARRRGTILHHATLAYSMDTPAMMRVLRLGKPSLQTRGVRSAEKIVAPLRLQTEMSRGAIVEHLLRCFHKNFGGSILPWTTDELKVASALADSKYATEAWTFDVP